MKRAERVPVLLDRLSELYPDATCMLENWSTPFMLLISTILSARTTDAAVNGVTPVLWETFPSPESLAETDPELVEKIVHPLGFFRNKAASIMKAAAWVVEHGGVPDEMEELVKIPGVGRKTAGVVLAEAFGKPAIIVDTHVGRLSGRLDLSRSTDPVSIEFDLRKLLPMDSWSSFSHELGLHGRSICLSRKPACTDCTLLDICPRRGV